MNQAWFAIRNNFYSSVDRDNRVESVTLYLLFFCF